jgi:GNAT superfamily N-acetyltransferase
MSISPAIRRAEPEDAPAIATCLASLGYATSPALVLEKLAALTNRSSDVVLLAVDPSAGVVGVVSIHVLPLFHAPGHVARLTALAVRQDQQGRGVGRALVQAAETFAWQADCHRVEVTSGDHRPGAHAFYEKLGYRVDERRFIKVGPPAVAV